MRTLLIFETTDGTKPQYAIVNGDYSRFNGVFINFGEHKYTEECYDFLFDTQGVDKIEWSEDIKIVESKEWDRAAFIKFAS